MPNVQTLRQACHASDKGDRFFRTSSRRTAASLDRSSCPVSAHCHATVLPVARYTNSHFLGEGVSFVEHRVVPHRLEDVSPNPSLQRTTPGHSPGRVRLCPRLFSADARESLPAGCCR